MSSRYTENHNSMTADIITQDDEKYYFAIRTKNKDNLAFSKWQAVSSPFVITGSKHSCMYGDFLSSTWFKMSIPQCCECAILRTGAAKNNSQTAAKPTPVIIGNMIDKMNQDNAFASSNFIEMFYSMSSNYCDDITRRLKLQLDTDNSEFSTIHSTLDHEKGTFGMSFAMRKGAAPCMYSPRFMLSKTS
jgi:hypothetical protein